MTSESTPRPWYQLTAGKNNASHISASINQDWAHEKHYVGIMSHINKANAQFIIKACNSHDELLEACKNTRFIINSDPTLHHLKKEPWWEKLEQAITHATE